MKVNTFKKYPFTVDLYTFTKSNDATGNPVLTYAYARNINVGITSSGFGRLYVFFKPEDTDAVANCQLTNLRDAKGVEFRPSGYWQLAACEPYMNMWGEIQGFKGNATFLGTNNGGV